MLGKRQFVDLASELLSNPGFEAVELFYEGDDCAALLGRGRPFNVECRLDALVRKHRNAGLRGQTSGRRVGQFRGATQYLPGCVREQIDGVLHSTSAHERSRIDGDTQLPRKFLPIERGSSAHRAGLQPGDYIVSINDKAVKSVAELNAGWVGYKGAMAVKVKRGDQIITGTFRQ